MSLRLDHLVINSHFALDEVAQWFRALGFTLTPTGYHTLGSINQLIMFDDNYLELIGLPAGGRKMREELVSTPPGLDGPGCASADSKDTDQDLAALGSTVQQTR